MKQVLELAFGWLPLAIYLNGWGFGSGLVFAAIVGAVMWGYGCWGLDGGRGIGGRGVRF